MSMISNMKARIGLAALALAAAGLLALSLGAAAPAAAEGSMNLQPPGYKYASQYARKSGMYLNLGNLAYVRVPTIRLRVGSVKFREVAIANNGGGGHFLSNVGHFRPGPGQYGKQQRIIVPIATPYFYLPYGSGGPFYGQPSGYVASYYGQPGYGMPNGRPPYRQLGYGGYGFNTNQALQGLPRIGQQSAYRGGFNATGPMVAVKQPALRPAAQPRYVHFNGATVKSGALPTVHKPAGKNFIRVE